MDHRSKELLEQFERLFSDRKLLESLWQEVALNFYPEMAEFSFTENVGRDYADHLTSSYPILARRTLGDMLSALLRPVNLDTSSPGIWFSIRSNRQDKEDKDAKRWLERATGIMRRAMYDQPANFTRATKTGDHSFATFGQAVLSAEMNSRRNGLLFRAWHLKDVVWCEDANGQIDRIGRKWSPTNTQLVNAFGKKTAEKVRTAVKDKPYDKVECFHIVIRSDVYGESSEGKKIRAPWLSLWIDKTNEHVMEEVPSFSRVYVIPRWERTPGSQYAYSPAVLASLPDARLFQEMTLTMLDAGEKAADPPMAAGFNVLRSDLNSLAGGLTWVDLEGDKKVQDVLGPLYQFRAGEGMRIGMELRLDVREAINRAFFLDSLQLPPVGEGGMSPFEVGQRISEWIRRAMPIFEPMEFEYNGQLCEMIFDLMFRNGGFGPIREIPDSLRGEELQFRFESPLHESDERRKGQKFLEAESIVLQAAQVDPTVMNLLDVQTALRDALDGIGVPANWTRGADDIKKLVQAQQATQEMGSVLQGADVAAGVAQKLGAAAKGFAGAQQGRPG